MSKKKGSSWYLKAGFTMFTMCNDKVSFVVQPAVDNMGICNRDTEGSPGEEYIEISSEDAEEVLSLIQDAINQASAGEGLDLQPAMTKASSLK